MYTEQFRIEQRDALLYDHANLLDQDPDYWFRLHGLGINPLIDAVTPLFGMVLRARHLASYDQVDTLYCQVVDEIQVVEQTLAVQHYEPHLMHSFRYILCAFIDEAVMGREWGRQSTWSAHSLLARFHNETWGGEKVFELLASLQSAPQRHRPLLEFIYLCLCLGFEGRYRVMNHGRQELEQIIRQLFRILYPHSSGQAPVMHLDAGPQLTPYRVRRLFSMRYLCLLTCLLLAMVFTVYYQRLDSRTGEVLQQLQRLSVPQSPTHKENMP